MQPFKHISIQKPCSESWNKMTPNSNGRHCDQCAKTVIDFTVMTDSEVIRYIQNSGKACGRFNETQLVRINQQLADKPKYAFSWKGLLAAASLMILSSTGKAETKEMVKTEQGPAYIRPAADLAVTDSVNTVSIKGRIIDKIDGQPLAGVTVMIKGTDIGTQTSMDGSFMLTSVKMGGVLQIKYLGYKTVELRVKKIGPGLTVSLEMESVILGGMGVVPHKPEPFYRRLFWKA